MFNEFPDYDSLKCFDCLAYASTIQQNCTKFDHRSNKCVFLGYQEGTKGCLLYNLSTNKFLISRNVSFYDSCNPFALTHDHLPIPPPHTPNHDINDLDLIPPHVIAPTIPTPTPNPPTSYPIQHQILLHQTIFHHPFLITRPLDAILGQQRNLPTSPTIIITYSKLNIFITLIHLPILFPSHPSYPTITVTHPIKNYASPLLRT